MPSPTFVDSVTGRAAVVTFIFAILSPPGLTWAQSGQSGEPALHAVVSQRSADELARRDAMAVCPPFFLRDEAGQVIDPVHGVNADRPYSPKQTCGACHDYARITRGFHFQQGRDEKLNPTLAAAYPWMYSPGQYGGRY